MSIKFFSLKDGQATELVSADSIALERDLQNLIEANLEPLLGVRFLQSEYTIESGRIDTLGIDTNGNPTIIEYKRHASSALITQVFGYLAPLERHQREFDRLVLKQLGKWAFNSVRWDAPRVICIAAQFNESDISQAKRSRGLELIRYTFFGENLLRLEWLGGTGGVSRIATAQSSRSARKTKEISYTDGISRASKATQPLYRSLRKLLLGLGADMTEKYNKNYVAFVRSNNVASVKFRQTRLLVSPNLYPQEAPTKKNFIRHKKGTSAKIKVVEISIASKNDLERAVPLLQRAYKNSHPDTKTLQHRRIAGKPHATRIQRDKNPIAKRRKKIRIRTHEKIYAEIVAGNPPSFYTQIQKFLLSCGKNVKEKPQKSYIAFTHNRNFACIELRRSRLLIFLIISPTSVPLERGFTRDVTKINHHGTGHLEVTIRTAADIEKAKPLLRKAYEAS